MRKSAGKTVIGSTRATIAGDGEAREQRALEADRAALDALFSLAYEELRRLASSVRNGDPGATLSPTALVNEAWLKLAESPSFATTSRLHFKRIAARAMRQVLIEAARRRQALTEELRSIRAHVIALKKRSRRSSP